MVEEINLGAVSTFGAATGAGAGGAGADGGATGALEIRPAEVSKPAGGAAPEDPAAAIALIGSGASFKLFAKLFLFGALGVLNFKFGIAGRRGEELSGCDITAFFS